MWMILMKTLNGALQIVAPEGSASDEHSNIPGDWRGGRRCDNHRSTVHCPPVDGEDQCEL